MFTSPTTPTTQITSNLSNMRQFLITPLHNRYDITSEIIKNIVHFAHFLRLCDESLSKYPIFKSNTTHWEIGTEFSLLVEDRIQIHFRLKTLVETDYYTHVEYFAYKTDPESFQYSFVMNAHYLTQGTCLLITNYMYPNTVNLPSTNQTKEAQRRRKLYRNMEYKIMRGFYQRFNVEYININCSMQFLWELILNLKSLQKFVHILGNKVDYEGKVISKVYADFEEEEYSDYDKVPWLRKEENYGNHISRVVVKDVIRPVCGKYWFASLRKCEYFDVTNLDMSRVTTIYCMFSGAGCDVTTKVTLLGISNWNISNITNMFAAFRGVGERASVLVFDDISGWDTSNVTDMGYMFCYTGRNANWSMDLSGWNVSKVTNYKYFEYYVENKIIAPNW